MSTTLSNTTGIVVVASLQAFAAGKAAVAAWQRVREELCTDPDVKLPQAGA